MAWGHVADGDSLAPPADALGAGGENSGPVTEVRTVSTSPGRLGRGL